MRCVPGIVKPAPMTVLLCLRATSYAACAAGLLSGLMSDMTLPCLGTGLRLIIVKRSAP